jgi:hypothetical protein
MNLYTKKCLNTLALQSKNILYFETEGVIDCTHAHMRDGCMDLNMKVHLANCFVLSAKFQHRNQNPWVCEVQLGYMTGSIRGHKSSSNKIVGRSFPRITICTVDDHPIQRTGHHRRKHRTYACTQGKRKKVSRSIPPTSSKKRSIPPTSAVSLSRFAPLSPAIPFCRPAPPLAGASLACPPAGPPPPPLLREPAFFPVSSSTSCRGKP